jgi:hypothetical protein
MCVEKELLIKLFIPKEHHPKRKLCETSMVSIAELPKGYQTYKSKCLDKENRGDTCTKDHAHEREICNNRLEPCGAFLRNGARALRLAVKLSSKHVWTCWNQSRITYEIRRRIAVLSLPDQFRNVCPCGRQKQRFVAIRVDAAQFFKAASVPRGIQRCKNFLAHLTARTKLDAVAVKRTKKSSGFLVKTSKRKDNLHTTVPFQQILAGIKYAAADKLSGLDTVSSVVPKDGPWEEASRNQRLCWTWGLMCLLSIANRRSKNRLGGMSRASRPNNSLLACSMMMVSGIRRFL